MTLLHDLRIKIIILPKVIVNLQEVFIMIRCTDILDSGLFVCLILYVPSTIFQLNREGSSWVEPVLS